MQIKVWAVPLVDCGDYMLFIFFQSNLGDHVSLWTISHIHICMYSTYSSIGQSLTMFKLYVFVIYIKS